MRYEFKKIIKNDYETYKYLLKIYNSISYCKDKEMIFELLKETIANAVKKYEYKAG